MLFHRSALLSLMLILPRVHAANRTSFSDILLPSPNITGGPVAEIQCYALPYGAIGIISHLLTYWTIAWMAVGRIPLWPGHEMKTYKFDMFLATLSLCTCIPIASITMHRCRLSWHFLLICIWKLVTSVSLGCVTLHRCIIVRRENKGDPQRDSWLEMQRRSQHQVYQNHSHNRSSASGLLSREGRQDGRQRNLSPCYWLILYLVGTIVGMVGLCSLLYTTFRKDRTIRNLTYGFGAAMAIIPIMVAIYWFTRNLERKEGGRRVLFQAYWSTFGGSVIAFTATFGFFSSLYSDLVLGTIADNIFGLPSQDFMPLYWAWFIAKRLPMLSF